MTPVEELGRCFHGAYHYSTRTNKLLNTCLFVTPTFPFHIIERFLCFPPLLAFIAPSRVATDGLSSSDQED